MVEACLLLHIFDIHYDLVSAGRICLGSVRGTLYFCSRIYKYFFLKDQRKIVLCVALANTFIIFVFILLAASVLNLPTCYYHLLIFFKLLFEG